MGTVSLQLTTHASLAARSVKAIETPHQVHFLHQYISYLQEHARPTPAQKLLANERACA